VCVLVRFCGSLFLCAGPLFKVTPEDDEDEAIVEKSATAAWSAVIAKVNNMKTEETGKRQFTSVSGPEYFGFGVPAIAKLIQGKIVPLTTTHHTRTHAHTTHSAGRHD
jgi:hypothetical protein